MTDYPAAIPMFAIQQLRCPKCRAHMKLARSSPGLQDLNSRGSTAPNAITSNKSPYRRMIQ